MTLHYEMIPFSKIDINIEYFLVRSRGCVVVRVRS